MQPVRAILFDLDGTLADTLRDVADAMNHVLEAWQLPTHERDDYRAIIGAGVESLVRGATPPSVHGELGTLVRQFRARYAEHMFDHSAPYPGIEEALAEIDARGVPVAVLSNKPDDATRACVERLFPAVGFRCVLGQRPGAPPKPDPSAALEIARAVGVEPTAVAFVGDSGIDMQTAVAASMTPIGVLWGFRERAELEAHGASRLLEHPRELLQLLEF